MKTERLGSKFLLIFAVALSMAFSAIAKERSLIAPPFPDIPGWEKASEIERYYPNTLYKYIDGGAELFLSYGFEELAVLYYERPGGFSLNVEIYRHADTENAFGIYSRERPRAAQYLSLGAEGYYTRGVINFYKGSYYVKLIGFGMRESDRQIMLSVAERIDKNLKASSGPPKLIGCFPDSAKIEHSEAYLPSGFLEHEFLRSVFTADYKLSGGGKDEPVVFKLFIIEAEDNADARNMLGSYLEWAREEGHRVKMEESIYSFRNDYQNAAGIVRLKLKGKYIWGVFSSSMIPYGYFMEAIEGNLERRSLLER